MEMGQGARLHMAWRVVNIHPIDEQGARAGHGRFVCLFIRSFIHWEEKLARWGTLLINYLG